MFLSHLLHLFSQTQNCGNSNAQGFQTGLPVVCASSDQLQQILQILFGVLAAVAVLIIVIAGFRFVLAENPDDAGKARGAIIYALVGLVIALSAEAIVSFVITGIK